MSEERPTPEEMAVLDFEAAPVEFDWPDAEWVAGNLESVKRAAAICRQTKAQLCDTIRRMEADTPGLPIHMVEDLDAAKEHMEACTAIMGTASNRLLIAFSVIAIKPEEAPPC